MITKSIRVVQVERSFTGSPARAAALRCATGTYPHQNLTHLAARKETVLAHGNAVLWLAGQTLVTRPWRG